MLIFATFLITFRKFCGLKLVVYKFLQRVPNRNKVYEKLKETINPSMTEQDMTAVFDKAQNKTSNFHVRDPEESNCKAEESDEDDHDVFCRKQITD